MNTTLNDIAKLKIRAWSKQIEKYRTLLRNKEITPEEYKQKTLLYKTKIEAVQSVFRAYYNV